MPLSTATRRRPTNVTVTINWGFDDQGEERRDGYVWLADDDGDEVGTVYGPMAPSRARELGRRMADDRRLELVIDEAY